MSQNKEPSSMFWSNIQVREYRYVIHSHSISRVDAACSLHCSVLNRMNRLLKRLEVFGEWNFIYFYLFRRRILRNKRISGTMCAVP
jgi:hypothetical protein